MTSNTNQQEPTPTSPTTNGTTASPPTSPPTSPYEIAIIGGGICGVTCAIALQAQGVPFHIYESHPKFTETGAGISLSDNGWRSLVMIDPRLSEILGKLVTRNERKGEEDTWLELRYGMGDRAGESVGKVKSDRGNGLSSLHRGTFLNNLATLIPASKITFNAHIVSLSPLPSSSPTQLPLTLLTFTSHPPVSHPLIIDASGIHSQLRLQCIDPSSSPKFCNIYSYRTLIPMSEALPVLGKQNTDVGVLYAGKGGIVLTYRIEKGTLLNCVATKDVEGMKWEGKWIRDVEGSRMLEDFEGWGEDALRVIELMYKPTVQIWAVFAHPTTIPSFVSLPHSLALLGDATHASSPHYGSGVGIGMEDALIISTLLGDLYRSFGLITSPPLHLSSSPSSQIPPSTTTPYLNGSAKSELQLEEIPSFTKGLKKVLKIYDKIRLPRGLNLIKYSQEAGAGYSMCEPGKEEEYKEWVEGRFKRNAEYIWGVDLVGMVGSARELMKEEGERGI